MRDTLVVICRGLLIMLAALIGLLLLATTVLTVPVRVWLVAGMWAAIGVAVVIAVSLAAVSIGNAVRRIVREETEKALWRYHDELMQPPV